VNEKLHRPLKRSYALRTNFKNVASQVCFIVIYCLYSTFSSHAQILRAEEWCLIAATIRNRIDESTTDTEPQDSLSYTAKEDSTGHKLSLAFERVTISSKQPDTTFEDLEQSRQADFAFTRFRIRLAEFFSNFLPAHDIPLPDGKRIKFTKTDKVNNIIIIILILDS
jgi:hypothetical protein